MPKTFKAVPCCWELACPHCNGPLPSPSGALNWTLVEIELAPKETTCFECGKTAKLPSLKLG